MSSLKYNNKSKRQTKLLKSFLKPVIMFVLLICLTIPACTFFADNNNASDDKGDQKKASSQSAELFNPPLPENWLPDLPTYEQLKNFNTESQLGSYAKTGKIISSQIEKDEAISSSLGRMEINYSFALELSQALEGIFDFRKCQIGNKWSINFNEADKIEWFVLHYKALESYFVRREHGTLKGYLITGNTETYIVELAGEIKYSLSNSLWKIGETDSLTAKIADIFAWDIDFYSDLQQGDTWRVLVEKRYYNDMFLSYGKVLAANFAGNTLGNMYAFYFETPDKKRMEYFDEQGAAVQKSFLRAPLNTTRVTSKFGFRMHPTLHKYKKHNGVDFGAPRGTPIWAIASGKVLKAGRMGACGIGAKLRHANGYISLYCHMSSVAVKPGFHVRQKQMIGRVGCTGRCTGPHLHFGLMKNGVWQNPTKMKYEPGKPLEDKYKEAWTPLKQRLKAQLDKISLPKLHGPLPASGLLEAHDNLIKSEDENLSGGGEITVDN